MPRPIPVEPPEIAATLPCNRPSVIASPYTRAAHTNKEAAIGPESCRIGIDAGTGEVRVAVRRSPDGRLLAEASAAFAIDSEGERRTVDFAAVGAAMDTALDEAIGLLPSVFFVEHVGIAATASTVAVASLDGRLLAPGRLWSDHRSTREAAAMRAAGHPNLIRMLGHVSPEWGIAKLAAMAAEGELDRPGADVVVELADWLAYRLTGAWVANAGTREWGWAGGDDGRPPRKLLSAAGVPEAYAERVLPDVRVTGSVLGEVGAAARKRHPRMAGALVLVGGMDSHLAALGMGAAIPGRMCVSVGSSSAVVAGLACGTAHGLLYGPMRRVLPGDPDGYWQGGQTTAGLAAAWAARVLGRSRASLEREALASPPGSRGVTFRETMLDRRNPRPAAPLDGAWVGLQLHHERGDLYRAVLEGVAIGLAEACETLRAAEVVVSGGMVRSRLFRGILADVLERPVGRLRGAGSAAALGAAFADAPLRVDSVARVVAITTPSGADYRDARARHLAASGDPGGGEA